MFLISSAMILIFASLFHFYWGFGGTVGIAVAVPQQASGERLFNPDAGGAHSVAFALLVAVLFILAFGGLVALPLPFFFIRGVILFLALVFTVRALGWFKYAGFFKEVRHTAFAIYDTRLYCPLCLFLGVSLGYSGFNS